MRIVSYFPLQLTKFDHKLVFFLDLSMSHRSTATREIFTLHLEPCSCQDAGTWLTHDTLCLFLQVTHLVRALKTHSMFGHCWQEPLISLI